MDLRRRLLGWLSALLGGFLLLALIVQLASLREDIETEITASSRLIDLLLAADAGEEGLAARIAGAQLRHLHIAGTANEPVAAVQQDARWLGLTVPADTARQIRIGSQTLYIAPNPQSEIAERMGDAVRLMITLLLYSAATLLAVWWATDRALSPVRELENGLLRLAAGKDDPALPAFALREFRRVAQAIDTLAAALREAHAARTALSRQMISLQESERRMLAHELHDEMGQTLTALNATAAHLERNAPRLAPSALAECCADMRRDLRCIGEQLRSLLKSLRPHGLDASNLAGQLRELVDNWRSRGTGIEFALSQPESYPELAEAAALTLYRVIQEALTNVVRHSGARHCCVGISAVNNEIRAEIADDGAGLPQQSPSRQGGLLGMAERLAMVGGRLEVASSPDGLNLRFHLPCHPGSTAEGAWR